MVGSYESREVVGLTDSGCDDKSLQNAIISGSWYFLTALKISRSASSSNQSIECRRIDDLFWATRKQSPWKTILFETDGRKKRRKFHVRKLQGYIRGITGKVALVCSEKSGKTGKRFYACPRPGIDAGVLIRAHSKRGQLELFHHATKNQFGLLDAGVEDFDAWKAHIHWVYCAYLLLHELEVPDAESLTEKQRRLTHLVNKGPWGDRLSIIIAAKTQCGGRKRQEILLRMALQHTVAL